ncbi:LLM class F420-dependent oxidoreductase [Rhodococcus koreensis]|uniref:LLM class F420-dependent oxidoreductase n=1 Tax=Rhodococcus koreensis TaxID=99653 RepID=UPI003672165B
MRLGTIVGHGRSMAEIADEVVEWEKAGLQSVTLGEAYSFDCVSQLGYLAAKTTSVEIATGILPLDTRTPTVLGMTAAGLDFVSEGRFRLGIGASGPQVIEGFHGLPFEGALGKTRETIAICRSVVRREAVTHQGRWYEVPLASGRGTGQGRPLKLINRPVRDSVAISVAALGPQTVEATVELADGWEPIFYYPERAESVWGESITRGSARRDSSLAPLEIIVRLPAIVLEPGEDPAPWIEAARPQLALYVGGMGSRKQNFYHRLARQYGFGDAADRIQDLFLAGRHAEAALAVPDELVLGTSLIGDTAQVRDRLDVLAAGGVTVVNAIPMRPDPSGRLRTIASLRSLLDN